MHTLGYHPRYSVPLFAFTADGDGLYELLSACSRVDKRVLTRSDHYGSLCASLERSPAIIQGFSIARGGVVMRRRRIRAVRIITVIAVIFVRPIIRRVNLSFDLEDSHQKGRSKENQQSHSMHPLLMQAVLGRNLWRHYDGLDTRLERGPRRFGATKSPSQSISQRPRDGLAVLVRTNCTRVGFQSGRPHCDRCEYLTYAVKGWTLRSRVRTLECLAISSRACSFTLAWGGAEYDIEQT
ncbi:hypothetical protein FHX08_005614 [Rhizobium sp. BK529]|nr:hypothetical protein [Rhizobium sp. BK529]